MTGLSHSKSSTEGNRVVVTATKREASLQDVPFSINAQTAEDIQRSGAASLEDLSRNVAGLAIQNLGRDRARWRSAGFLAAIRASATNSCGTTRPA